MPLAGGLIRLGGCFVRLIWCCFGVVAALWVFFVLPTILQQAPIIAAAKRIVAGDVFKREALDKIGVAAQAVPISEWKRPSVLSSIAIVDLRLLETAIGDANTELIDQRQQVLERAIRLSLANVPADPYLWLVLFWLENSRNGFTPDHLKYLAMSYSLGPNEGWIAVKRNRLAIALYPQLSPELREKAVTEFAGLVSSGFIAEAAAILTGPGWPIRAKLLQSLANIDDIYREQFAKTVYRLGYDIVVPGVKPFGFRPWQ